MTSEYFIFFYRKYFEKTLRDIFIFLEAHVTIVQDIVTEKKSLYKGFQKLPVILTIPVGFRIEVKELLLDAQLFKPQHTNNCYLCKYFVLYFLIILSLPLSKFDLYIRFYISFRYIVPNYYSLMKVLLTNMQFILNLINTDRFIIISVPMVPQNELGLQYSLSTVAPPDDTSDLYCTQYSHWFYCLSTSFHSP